MRRDSSVPRHIRRNGVCRRSVRDRGTVCTGWTCCSPDSHHRVVLEGVRAGSLPSHFSYLQRDVPPGYEYALGLYCCCQSAVEIVSEPWRPVANSESQVENLIVARLQRKWRMVSL